jgi:hypothetical protein
MRLFVSQKKKKLGLLKIFYFSQREESKKKEILALFFLG